MIVPADTCSRCEGARAQGRHCLAHLTPAALDRLAERLAAGEPLDARAVRITPRRLAALLDRLRAASGDVRRLPSADFRGARFTAAADFSGVQFADARFAGARFSGVADFSASRFCGVTEFVGARFSDRVDFSGAHLQAANFERAEFTGHAVFRASQFPNGAMLDRARFADAAIFELARFPASAHFSGVDFAFANFQGVEFDGEATFAGARFSDNCFFRGARFAAETHFEEAEFAGAAYLGGVQFEAVVFDTVRFSGGADFRETQFARGAYFREAEFAGTIVLRGRLETETADDPEAREGRAVSFRRTQFSDLADFGGARFVGEPDFRHARFLGTARFGGVMADRDARFVEAIFHQPTRLGPLTVAGRLWLDDTAFEADVRLEARAASLSCLGTRFGGRADLRVSGGDIALDDATFGARSVLAGTGDDRPRLLSVRQANVGNLAVGNVDLRSCRFFGAHRLDELRLEADCDFPQPPPARRYTRRRTLAEEQQWRAKHIGNGGWHPEECRPTLWLEADRPDKLLDPSQIAALYRQLRKGLEDRKDQPGAGDFYYGEMEMRRSDPSADPWERAIITLYWLICGYALRASRAILALLAVIALFALLFDAVGFAEPADARVEMSTTAELADAAIYSAGTATAVLGAPSRPLTRAGDVLRITLRVLGPVLVGLALLSIRGRVKR